MDDRIPTAILESLNLYHREGIPTGGFLQAVLANDLTQAIGRADENSLNALRSIVKHIYMEMPSACWGSYEDVNNWIQKKGRK